MAIVVVVAPRGAPASIRLREAPSPCLLGNSEGDARPGSRATRRDDLVQSVQWIREHGPRYRRRAALKDGQLVVALAARDDAATCW
jgi:hypothetical protein